MVKRLFALAALYLGVSLIGGAVVVDRALHRPRAAITDRDHAHAAELAVSLGAGLDTVAVSARDGAGLQGWLFTPPQPNGHSVILMHGITSNRASLLPRAGLLVRHGYRALALDGRGHGASGGDLVTFGALEADDTRRWVAWLRSRAPGGCVFLAGDSLGAAVAVQASDAAGVCGVVAQSAFASLREIAFDRVGQPLHLGPWAGRSLFRPGLELGLLYVRARYGVDPAAGSALSALHRAGPPVLLIHGDLDRNTPVRHAHALQRANPARVTLQIVSGGGHEGLGAASPGYDLRIIGFLAARAAAPVTDALISPRM